MKFVCVLSFNRGQVDCIKQIFLSRYLFLFNYCTTSYYTVFLYGNCPIIEKNMRYRYLSPIVELYLLQDNSIKSLNKKYYAEHKTLVLGIVFFVKGFDRVVFK